MKWLLRRDDLASIDLLVLDADGVMTDGGLWIDHTGQLQKRFDVHDGLGIILQQVGVHVAIISGGRSGATEFRAQQLGIKHCLTGVKDKPVALLSLQNQLGVCKANTAFLGDDLNDLAVVPIKLLLATANAVKALRSHADAVLSRSGGYGAVRELSERILHSKGALENLNRYGWSDRND